MASVLKGSSPDKNPWWTEYVHISKTGIPICHPKKPGHCRAIQQKHKSSEYCSYKPGRYVLCDQPGQGEVAEKLWYPPTPDAVKTLSRKERSPRDRIFVEGDEWSGSRRSKCKQQTQGDPSRCECEFEEHNTTSPKYKDNERDRLMKNEYTKRSSTENTKRCSTENTKRCSTERPELNLGSSCGGHTKSPRPHTTSFPPIRRPSTPYPLRARPKASYKPTTAPTYHSDHCKPQDTYDLDIPWTSSDDESVEDNNEYDTDSQKESSCSEENQQENRQGECHYRNQLSKCLERFRELALMQKKARQAIEEDELLPNYDDVIDKYGWRAEIPGDPFGVKPYPHRLPYHVQIPYQSVQLHWPRRHYKVSSPFFSKTVQSARLSYVVHPDFMSEQLEEKPQAMRRVAYV